MRSARAALALTLLLSCMLTAAVPVAAQPEPAGEPKPFRVLFDRRVDFPLAALAFSRDGKQLAGVGATYAAGALPQYRVVVVDVGTGRKIHELPMHAKFVNRLVFAPDGKVLYAGVNPHSARGVGGNTLVAWDIAAGKPLRELTAHDWDLSPDGRRLAVVENWSDIDPGLEGRAPLPSTYTVRVLDTANGKELSRLHEVNAVLSTLRFAPDGQTLALSVPDYSIRLWHWQGREEIVRFEATKLDAAMTKLWGAGRVNTLAFHPKGKLLATVTGSLPEQYLAPLKIDLWDTATGKLVRSLDGSKNRPALLAFTPDGDRIALADLWNEFLLLDAATGKPLQTLRYPARADLAAALYRDGRTPAQSPGGPPLLKRLWNLASSDDPRAGEALESPQCLTFAPDHRTLAIGDQNGFVHLVDVVTGKELHRLGAGQSTVSALVFLDGGKLPCSQHRNAHVRFWDVATGKPQPLRLAGAFPGSSTTLVASPDGRLAAGSNAPFVMLWTDYRDRRPRRVACPGGTQLLRFTPDGTKLLACAVTGNTGKVQVIDVAAGKVTGTIGEPTVATFGLAPDGTVATWGHTTTSPWVWDKTVRLWDLSGASRGELAVTPATFHGMHFTPDSRCLFVEQEGGLGLWEIASRKLRTFVRGGSPYAVSGDGRFVVTTTPGCLLVWDLTSRTDPGPP